MIRASVTLLVMLTALAAGQTSKNRLDLVPDEKTAVRIAEAVFIAQYGEERINMHRPFSATTSGEDNWLVQLAGPGIPSETGGGPGLFINKHSGCLSLLPHMK
jgi:NTF2 fold immunity protein